MPREAGRRWLAEVESILFEISAPDRAKIVRNYMLTGALKVSPLAWGHSLRDPTRWDAALMRIPPTFIYRRDL